MTVWQQALHVARKDLRFVRRLLLTYLVLLAASTASWLLGVDAIVGVSPLLGLTIVVFAMFIAAFLVHEDSPARRDLLWTTLPLRPAALVSAKLLAVGVAVVAAALLAQAAALSQFGLPALELLWISVASAALLATAVLFAMLAGSLARNRLAIALLLTVVPLLASIVATLASVYITDGQGADAEGGIEWRLLLIAPLVALFAHHYVTRRTRRTAVLTAVLLAAVVLLPPLPSLTALRTGIGAETAAGPMVRVVGMDPEPGTSRIRLQLALHESHPALRYELDAVRARVLHDDARVEPLRTDMQPHVLTPGRFFQTFELHFDDTAVQQEHGVSTLYLTTSTAQRDALLAGRAVLELAGTMLTFARRTHAELPLAQRAVAVLPGERLTIRSIDDVREGAALRLHYLGVGSAADRWRSRGSRPMQYLLVHGSGEAIELRQTSSDAMSAMLVVPGAAVVSGEIQLEPQRTGDASVSMPAPEWLERAHLVVRHWVQRDARGFLITMRATPTDPS